MRHALITPLASRDGSTAKDEKLVNAYSEVDRETKETSVFKRPGLSLSDAVLTGNDIYGQGMFNYVGYWYSIIGDILFWYDINGTQQGVISFGAIVIWDNGDTYDIGDAVIHDGVLYYSYVENNTGNTPGSSVFWSTTAPTADRYLADFVGAFGFISASKDAAGASAYAAYPYKSCGSAGPYDETYDQWRSYVGITTTGGSYGHGTVIGGQYLGPAGNACSNPWLSGQGVFGEIQKIA